MTYKTALISPHTIYRTDSFNALQAVKHAARKWVEEVLPEHLDSAHLLFVVMEINHSNEVERFVCLPFQWPQLGEILGTIGAFFESPSTLG